jgi:hypothetical protein
MVLLCCCCFCFGYSCPGKGQESVATIYEIVQDVEEAVSCIIQRQRNKELLNIGEDEALSVLRGYSSGAHFVATWLSSSRQQQQQQQQQLLYLSGVECYGILE